MGGRCGSGKHKQSFGAREKPMICIYVACFCRESANCDDKLQVALRKLTKKAMPNAGSYG